MKNRRVVVERYGGPEVMHVVEEELPVPGAGQARVRVLAADVSFSDVNVRRGRYPGGPRPPFTPGYAFAGVVDELGPEITEPQIGRAVAALSFHGAYSEYICLNARSLVPIQRSVDPSEAACLALSYVSALQMMQRVAHVQTGASILVHGAAGGVGTAFLELGRTFGLKVYGTASRPKHEIVTRLGATPIDYRGEDFVSRVLDMTGGVGVDAAFDPIGAAHLKQSERAVRRGGNIVAFGYYEASNRGRNPIQEVLSQYLLLALWSLPPRRKHVAFYDIRSLHRRHPDWYGHDYAVLVDLLAEGKIKPPIAARLILEDAARAHQLLESAEVQGKLVLTP